MDEELKEARSDVNKYGIYIAIPLLCIAGAILYFGPQKPCVRPITYYVRTISPGFSITQTKAVEVAQRAADTWNRAAGKDVFVFKEDGVLPIDFVYDNRQKLSLEASRLEETLGVTENKITNLKLAYQAREREYEEMLALYNYNLEKYNKNKTKQAYENLLQEHARLTSYAAKTDLLIQEHNSLVKEVDTDIAKYNSNPLIGTEFEAGLYSENQDGRRIDIYEYKNDTELLRLMMHELGHALTIGHTENPESIMYELNTGNSTELANEDISALRTACNL